MIGNRQRTALNLGLKVCSRSSTSDKFSRETKNIEHMNYALIFYKDNQNLRLFGDLGREEMLLSKLVLAWTTNSSRFHTEIVLAPKFGARPIRLTPPVRPVFLNGLTGGASCSRSGNGHTNLSGGPDRSDRWTPSPSRIEESLRISSCKRIPCGARPPHLINKKGHDRLRGNHPIDHYFLQLLSLKP
jgi:hypothetical protein